MIIVNYQELLLPRTSSISPQSCQGHHHLDLLLAAATSSYFYRDLLRASQGRRTTTSSSTDCTAAAQDTAFEPSGAKTANMGASNVMDNVTEHNINAMRGFAVREGQPRPTEDTRNAGRRGRTRAASPCLPRRTRTGAINAKKPVTKFDDDLGRRLPV